MPSHEPEVLILTVHDLARGGAGVARDAGGRVVFIPFTAPGDQVRVRITRAEKRYAQGELLEILNPSPDRVAPKCAVFGRCGGCQWQHLPYALQWKTKSRGVEQALARAGISLAQPLEELPAERIWEYRNRIQLRGEKGSLGFHAAGSNTLVPVERCEIARSELNARLPELRAAGARLDRPYKSEVEVFDDGRVEASWNRGHAALGFRQVHDEQNRKLRAWVAGAVSATLPVLDLFGGRGNLGAPLAEGGREVHCVDVTAPREGSPAGTLSFHRAPVRRWLTQRREDGRAWAAVVDPPREGLGPDFAAIAGALERLGVIELVAVGCDADAWSRDVSGFVKHGWRLERAAALDLFPQTPHVESLARLIREA